MIRHSGNWPAGTRFATRLAAVERLVMHRHATATRANSGILDLLEVSIGFDVWDGVLNPDDVESRFRRDFVQAAKRCGVRADASIPDRIERLREHARRTYSQRSQAKPLP